MTVRSLPVVKCLIVDDRVENLVALRGLLRGDGVEVLEARSGAEALELLLAHDVALAILDVRMPSMDGFELAELMRGSERTRNIPLIFVTAASEDRERAFAGYESGAVDFLHKPIDPAILRSKANVFFELHRQRQQLAIELRERTEALRLNEMFTAVLGHDLRDPLSAVTTSAEMLRLSGDAAVAATAGRILASAERMRHMIDDVLDLARARLAGGIPVAPQPADLGALVQRVVVEHEAANPGRRIAVTRAGDLAGEWDPVRIAQVASNLIGNSLRHGTPATRVDVDVDGRDRDVVRLTVANEGSIPAHLVASLFDPFRGAQNAADRRAGLGLGLYIVRKIVESHRGEVRVNASVPDVVRFEISVPRRVDS